MQKKIFIVLIILFMVIISGCTFKTESDQTFGEKPLANASDIYIVNSTGEHYDENGTLIYYVWGYVGNKGEYEAQNVEIAAKFYDENGKLIGTNKTTPQTPKVVPPEGKSYYYVGFEDPNNAITKYELSLAIKNKK